MKQKRIAIKIGSNVLTRANGTLDVTRMSALVDQLAFLHKQGFQLVSFRQAPWRQVAAN